MKRIFALLLAAIVLLSCATALAEPGVSVRTTLSGSSRAKRDNVDLAARSLNEVVVPCGAYFSFNELIGPRTAARGYRNALNGRGAEVTGGGVAQAASTLYLALLELGADVEFEAIETYGERFRDNYVSNPDEAILVDYNAGIDFAFTNWDDDFIIEMWTTRDYLYCAITYMEDEAEEEPFLNWSTSGPVDFVRLPVASVGIDLRGCSDAMYNNILLAASSINDTLLRPGDLFSFNDSVGPRIEEYGYEIAVNGRGVEVVGGGVAQVASAIWMAVKQLDDVAIVEKSTYGDQYNQDYVSSSNDAILTDFRLGTDFSLRNCGDGAITICTYIQDDVLYCEILQD